MHFFGELLLLFLVGLRDEEHADELHDEVARAQDQENARRARSDFRGEVVVRGSAGGVRDGTDVVGVDVEGLDEVENEGTEAKAEHNEAVSETAMIWEPFHC